MVAIYDEDGTLDVNKLTTDIKEQLPVYARPQFVRILTKIDLTGMYVCFSIFFKILPFIIIASFLFIIIALDKQVPFVFNLRLV